MVKVEMQRNEENSAKGYVAFAIEASTEADLEVVDGIVEAIMGSYVKRGGFVNNKRFVFHLYDPLLKTDDLQ